MKEYVFSSDPSSKASYLFLYKLLSGNVNSFVLLTLGSGYWPTGYAIFNFLSLYVEPGIMRCKPFVIIMETHWEINEKPSKNSTKWKHSQCENDLKLFFFVNIFNLAKLLFYWKFWKFSKILMKTNKNIYNLSYHNISKCTQLLTLFDKNMVQMEKHIKA